MVARNETRVLQGISPVLQQFLRIYFTAGCGGACLCNHRDLDQPGLQSKILDSQGYSEKSYLEKQRNIFHYFETQPHLSKPSLPSSSE